MGLFKHKDKTRADVVSETPSSNPASTEGSSPQHQHQNSYHDSAYYSNSNASSADAAPSPGPSQQQQQQQQQQPPQRQSQPPGTTVTTTTTTTTTTTAIAPDGTTHTYSAPYNPSTDPPPQASETTVDKNLPANARINTGISPNPQSQTQAQQQSYNQAPPTIKQTGPTPDQSQSAFQPPARRLTPKQSQKQYAAPPPPGSIQPQHSGNQAYNQHLNPQPNQAYTGPEEEVPSIPLYRTTSGGRTIPPRSELRNSPGRGPAQGTPSPINNQAASAASPPMPERSERRKSREYTVAPLNTNPVSELPAGSLGVYGEQPITPTMPTNATRPKTPNFSRPGVHSPSSSVNNLPQQNNLGNTTTISSGITPAAATTEASPVPAKEHKLERKRGSVTAALKGLHGAGEAVRGQLNSTIARGMHDSAEEERMRAVRDKGLGEWRGSGLSERVPVGLREGFREKAGDRLRSRRLSQGNGIHGSEGPNGLDPVEERSIGD
ncbi:hypothetical protein BDZ45DRAFT_668554 [Acephala macrosclerotiorum]|nr:hypothetical protein BDZ45DRAFT_668554 [Acephala macrosclerotiorum]